MKAEVTALCKRLVVQANRIDYDFADDVLVSAIGT